MLLPLSDGSWPPGPYPLGSPLGWQSRGEAEAGTSSLSQAAPGKREKWGLSQLEKNTEEQDHPIPHQDTSHCLCHASGEGCGWTPTMLLFHSAFLPSCATRQTCLMKPGVLSKDFLPGKADKVLQLPWVCTDKQIKHHGSCWGVGGGPNLHLNREEKRGTMGRGRGGAWQQGQGATPEPCAPAWVPEPALMAAKQQQKEKNSKWLGKHRSIPLQTQPVPPKPCGISGRWKRGIISLGRS